MVRLFSILILLLSGLITNAQEDLFDLLDDGPQPTQFTYATFKGTKLLNGQEDAASKLSLQGVAIAAH